MGRTDAAERLTLSGAIILFALAGVLPLAVVFGQSLIADGAVSLRLYRALLSSPQEWRLLGRSALLAGLVALGAAALGGPLGLFLAKTDVPGRAAWTALFTVPLLVPPYIYAIGWFYVLGRGGLVGAVLGPAAAARTSSLFFGLPGCVGVLSVTFMPVIMLLTVAFAAAVPPRLEEAARLVAGWPAVLSRITVPLAVPGLALGALLVFLLALGEFGVPMFLRYDVYAVESYTQFSAFYDAEAATAAALPLALIALLLLALERRFLGVTVRPLPILAPTSKALRLSLGRGPGVAALLVLSLGLFLVALPLGALANQAGSGVALAEAVRRGGDALARSLGFAAAGATALTALGFLLGYLAWRRALPGWRLVDAATILLFALPSIIIGIGLVTVWNRPATSFIYATPLIVVLGYVAKYTALTSRAMASALAQLSPSIEEAARLVGAGWFRRTGRIIVPLVGRGLAVAWLVGFLFCLRDVGLTMMVYPAGYDTLPVRTFTLMANGPPALIAALCVLMAAVALVPFAALALLLTWSRS